MDTLAFVVILTVVLISSISGYMFVQHFFLFKHQELEVVKLFQEGNYEKIIALAATTKSKFPPDALLVLARSYTRLDYPDKAVATYQELMKKISIYSDFFSIVCGELGDLYLKKNNYNEAESIYRLGLSAQPAHVFLRYKLSSLLSDIGEYSKARVLIKELLKENPKLADARRLYAEVLASMGMYSKAIVHYGILDRSGEKIISYYYAKTLKELKIIERSIEVYTKLLENSKDVSKRTEMILDCAQIYLYSTHYEEAFIFIEKYLPFLQEPLNFELRYLRASLRMKKGDEYLALQEFNILFQEDPSYKDLKQLIDQYGFLLAAPVLKNYFTSDVSLFEKYIFSLLPAGVEVTKRSRHYYVCCQNNKAYVFFRHIYAAPRTILDEIDMQFHKICGNASAVDIYSLSDILDQSAVSRRNYTIHVIFGDNFIKYFSEGFKPHPFVSLKNV